MGIISWFKKKSYEKSAANIITGLRSLVAAVRVDLDGTTGNLYQIPALGALLAQGGELPPDKMVALAHDLGAGLAQGEGLSEAELTGLMQAVAHWRTRKANVIETQKKLYQAVALWSSLSLEQSFKEVILPALLSGQLVAPSEPCFNPVIVAVYRVCQAAAKQKGVDLEAHTPPEILQIVKEAGDLYM
jgi:hypothetical protein